MRSVAPTIVAGTLVILLATDDAPVDLCWLAKQAILLFVLFIILRLVRIRQVILNAEVGPKRICSPTQFSIEGVKLRFRRIAAIFRILRAARTQILQRSVEKTTLATGYDLNELRGPTRLVACGTETIGNTISPSGYEKRRLSISPARAQLVQT